MESLKPCQFRQVDTQGRILCQLVKGGDRQVSVDLCRACPVQAINCRHLRAGLEKQVSTPITVRYATGRVEVWNDAPAAMTFKQAACAAKTIPIHSPRDCAGCSLRLPNVIPQNAIPVAVRPEANAPAAASRLAQSANSAPSAAIPRGKRTTQAMPGNRAALVSAQQAKPPQTNPAPIAPTAVANDLIARAKATAQKKAQEQAVIAQAAQRAAAEEHTAYTAEPKSKIIQLQQWLSGQITRKQANQPLPIAPDGDGVSEIVYAPLGGQAAQAFQESVDYERCVGWTD